MTIKELKEKLSEFDENLEIVETDREYGGFNLLDISLKVRKLNIFTNLSSAKKDYLILDSF